MDKWISVEDRLPEIGVPVWIDAEGQAGIGARCDMNDGTWMWGFALSPPYWDDESSSWVIDGYDCENEYPSSWMPLPSPPTTP